MTKCKGIYGIQFLLPHPFLAWGWNRDLHSLRNTGEETLTFLCLFPLLTCWQHLENYHCKHVLYSFFGCLFGICLSLGWAHSPLIHKMSPLGCFPLPGRLQMRQWFQQNRDITSKCTFSNQSKVNCLAQF